jgi:squalene-hopene/tetraprenyl-beta-curcumene cyclase
MLRSFVRSFVLASLPIVSLAACLVAAEPAAPPKTQYEFEKISVPAASADEPLAAELSVEKALAYLDDGANAWAGTRKCVSCHTNGAYLSLRPALAARVGPPDEKVREFFLATLKQKQELKLKSLQGGTAPDQIIYLAAGLAQWDRFVAKLLSPETDAALKLMLSIQRDDGTWGNAVCWPPYESDMYHPATVAAMALADAPGWLENLKDEKLLAGVERLKQYLRTTPPPHDYARVLLLWTASRVPGLIDASRRAELVEMLMQKQREDGGWSIRTFAKPEQWGSGNRTDKLRGEPEFASPPSDGHMTGLAIVALRSSGVAKDDPRIARGIGWIKTHQRASGRWWTRSLNTDKFHFITYSGTVFPLLALDACDAWPAKTAAIDRRMVK